MLGNWVQATSSSPGGTGAITIAAVTGYPAPNDHFGLLRPFVYSILNPDGTPVESGLGHLTAANTLSRDLAYETFVGGVLNKDTPAFVNLTNGTTYTVVISTESGLLAQTMPAVAQINGTYSNRFASMPAWSGITTFTLTANSITFVPVYLDCAKPITGIALDISTAVASSNVRVGLYSILANGMPGNLLFDSGSLSGASAAMVVASLTQMRYPPGWYWLAVLPDSAIAVRGVALAMTTPFGWSGATGRYQNVAGQYSQAYGALPAVGPTSFTSISTTGNGSNVPVAWFVTS